MFLKKGALLLLFLFTFGWVSSQEMNKLSILTMRDNDSIIVHPKRPWKAALETFGLNIGIGTFDRFVLQGDYAKINFSTIKHNFETGFVWDNDQFATNLFAHPYTGGLYFNTARNNGLNFYQSMPYSFGGSLMWELFMENEPPAINDLIATTVGGFSLGEITYRLSDLVIDSRTTGFERFGREFLTLAISPMTGLNRILSGDAWKTKGFRGRSTKSVPAVFKARAMYKGLTDDTDLMFNDFSHSLYVDLGLIYGDPFNYELEKPYEYFSFKVGFNLISDNQPILSNINGIGLIWGKNIELKKPTRQLILGIFQHFDYYDSSALGGEDTEHAYQISEAAAFGGGLLYKSKMSKNNTFLFSAYLNGVLLGASLTDHYSDVDRHYNLGSGYSGKAKLGFLLGSKIELGLSNENYRIYTWKGYDPDVDLSQLSHEEQLYLNVQGDKGNARLNIVDFSFNYHINKSLNLSTNATYYNRKSNYAYFDDVKCTVAEAKIGLGYTF